MGISSYTKGTSAQVQSGSADYYEYKTTGHERFVPGQADAIKVYDVGWSGLSMSRTHVDFVRDLLGYSTLVMGSIHRVTPQAHPILTNLFATEATVEPLSLKGMVGTGHSPDFRIARVITVYRFLDYLIEEDMTGTGTVNELYRYCTRTYTVNAKYLSTMRNLHFETKVNGQFVKPTERGGFIEPTIEKTILWHEVPVTDENVPNYSVIQGALGRVNSTTFDGDQPGTVLFIGCVPHKSAPTVGTDSPYWNIELKFLIKDIKGDGTVGHNQLWNPYSKQYETLWDNLTSNTGNNIYDKADLNTIFELS